MSDVSTGVQKAIAHNVCGGPPAKLSKADWKPCTHQTDASA